MNNNDTALDRFKRNVETIKKQIVSCTKEISKAIRDTRKAKSENDKKSLLELVSRKRKDLESYKLALDDLTYAFIEARPYFGKKIVSKFGYKTVEGYLADKQNGEQPSLREMMEVITVGLGYLPTIYSYSWDEDGVKRLHRNFDVINQVKQYQRPNFTEPVFSSSDPIKDVHDAKMVAGVVASASRHR
jgi:hypothetical protein